MGIDHIRYCHKRVASLVKKQFVVGLRVTGRCKGLLYSKAGLAKVGPANVKIPWGLACPSPGKTWNSHDPLIASGYQILPVQQDDHLDMRPASSDLLVLMTTTSAYFYC
ncbi:hypothetical protein DL546_005955 [Coniochaeta pulveracea]|uniref:Uncharacterized protein n=1 Tax=Coniochaeta pulveracea TaxID=177199 RepID=A0A420YEA4_9PEZI|nr:hypothetical protein DL546_005955 [Coniochaeta pulveracea]